MYTVQHATDTIHSNCCRQIKSRPKKKACLLSHCFLAHNLQSEDIYLAHLIRQSYSITF